MRHKSNDYSQILFGIIASLLLLLGTTGCVSRIAAGRIVSAPNRTPSGLNKKLERFFVQDKFQKRFLPDDKKNPFSFVTIPVGPPDAKLKAMILPPQNYPVKVVSKYFENTNSYGMSFGFEPATNSFTPLKNPATIFLLHGYSMAKESMVLWAFSLAQAGYRVVLVDLRGHGQSTGWQVSFGKYETADLTRTLDYLIEKNLCDERVGVLGMSYGATLALHWAAKDSRVRTVVAIAPYNQPNEAMERFAIALKIPVSQKAMREGLEIASGKLKLNWTDWSGETAMRQLKEPVLLISAENDKICPPQDAETMKTFAPIGTQRIHISKANHFMIGYWFHELEKPVASWFAEHLEHATESNQEKRLLISEKTGGGDSSLE